ncbi:MAG: OmpA family protein [Bryobacteraceae bacterium]
MRRHSTSDHLSSSLTDLMTSLAVIFILLLVAKLNNQATRTDKSINYVMDQLQQKKLFREGEKMRRDGDVLVVAIPQELMSFKQANAEQGGADLSPQGRDYLKANIPRLAAVLCRPDVRKKVDTIVVEGHSDKMGFGLADEKADEQENLKLSQQRSMAVVAESLNILGEDRACFLDLLSATGRGDAHPLNVHDLYSPENRRVELRIRIRPDLVGSIPASLAGSMPGQSVGVK